MKTVQESNEGRIKRLEEEKNNLENQLSNLKEELLNLKHNLVDNKNYFKIKTYINKSESISFIISKKIYETIEPKKLTNSIYYDFLKIFNVNVDENLGNITEFEKYLEPFILDIDYFIADKNS